ncbi:MAG: DUF2330 domain-containing protein, partial [Sedimentisphaerales bacterium]
TLTESGQRAIIGWDGSTQVLCLGTDVSSSRKTTVIEFLPLPSEPNVTLGSRKTFEAAEKLLARRSVKLQMPRTRTLGLGKSSESVPFHITFHQRLGAHDVTVVKVNRPDEFADWVQEKAKALTGGQVSLPDSIRELIAKYLNEYNCPYFVFDVIEVGPDPRSVEPIIYEFKSSEVFYPLEISSTFHGQTTIDLVIFSWYPVDQHSISQRGFLLSNFVEVNASEMQKVLPRLKLLLGKSAFLQVFRYIGRISRLRGNITAGPNREQIALSLAQYRTGKRRSLYSGIIAGTIGGVLIAFMCLWLMYFTAKRQQPRWGLRLLAGFLIGMPLGFVLFFIVVHIIGGEYIWEYNYLEPVMFFATPSLNLRFSPVVTFTISSVGMGFIIFCFQLGLRRRWYIWGLVYAALAIPLSYIGQPVKFLVLLNRSLLGSGLGLGEMGSWFIMHIGVFVSLFLIARLLIWITGSRKIRRSSLSK